MQAPACSPCPYVTGIDAGSWLQMRTGPGHGYADVPYGRLDNGSGAGLKCWSTGDGTADNPAGPAVWQQRIPHC